MVKSILVTGAAGFIGAALVNKLLKNGYKVIGIDNLNSYYDPNLKKQRLRNISLINKNFLENWTFFKGSLENQEFLDCIFKDFKFDVVVNLAAQAGVRFSINNPLSYIQSNLVGFANLLEECKKKKVQNLIYASSSSVYGGNKNLPFSENQAVNHPVSLYAATKRSNELLAHSYSHLYGLPCTGLRFFTVYGPWGRPDMAPMIFTKSILSKKPIDIFNYGIMQRDFTYIDDAVEAVFRCCFKPATPSRNFNTIYPNPSESFAPYRIFNVGNSKPVKLLKFIKILEDFLGIKAIKNYLPMQLGDVEATAANTELIDKWISFKPSSSLEFGIEEFTKWYINYYNL